MKLQIASDIHTEFYQHDKGKRILEKICDNTADNVDALLVAGDLSTKQYIEYAFDILCGAFKHVVYVTGNHEYYHSTKLDVHIALDKCAKKHSNLHWLSNSVTIIQGKRFVGTTLWFPATQTAFKYRMHLSDFNVINDIQDWIWQEFEKNKSFLSNTVQPGDIVLTHHIPCEEAVHPNWKGNPSNCFFVGDVRDIIVNMCPALHVFGHTHDGTDIILNKTRVVSNPSGYPSEKKPFDFNFVVEV